MATNNAYSDLVHLFIDGEATETERNLLFGALKDSPELQEEFSSAMQLKQAFASDIMRLQPPSYLQSKIAERAGLIVAASSSVATAPAVVNSVSTAVSNMAPMAATGISKGLLTLIIGTSVGVLSTIGVIKMTSSNAVKNTSIASAPVHEMPQQMNHVPNALEQVTARSQIDIANAGWKNAAGVSAKDHTFIMKDAAQNNSAEIKTGENKITNNSDGIPQAVVTPDNTSEQKPIAAIGTVNPKSNVIGENGSIREMLRTRGMMNDDAISRFSIKLMGISTLNLNQGDNSIKLPIWNNIGVGLKYDLDPANAVAVEAGQETFPIYLVNSSGGFDQHHSITWVGASFTYSAIALQFLGIHPDLRVLAGESNAGPVGKFSFGFVLPISTRFSIGTDFEETGLMINKNGATMIGSKQALTGSVVFHF